MNSIVSRYNNPPHDDEDGLEDVYDIDQASLSLKFALPPVSNVCLECYC